MYLKWSMLTCWINIKMKSISINQLFLKAINWWDSFWKNNIILYKKNSFKPRFRCFIVCYSCFEGCFEYIGVHKICLESCNICAVAHMFFRCSSSLVVCSIIIDCFVAFFHSILNSNLCTNIFCKYFLFDHTLYIYI